MLEAGGDRGRDGVREELVDPGLGDAAAQVGIAQEHEHDRERQQHIHRPAHNAEKVWALAEHRPRPWIRDRHGKHADQEGGKPRHGPSWPQRQDRV